MPFFISTHDTVDLLKYALLHGRVRSQQVQDPGQCRSGRIVSSEDECVHLLANIFVRQDLPIFRKLQQQIQESELFPLTSDLRVDIRVIRNDLRFRKFTLSITVYRVRCIVQMP
uniref:Uncharacterized protein n=1 Tax=Anopheles farauti TaxID=69004 RepID=A0A182QSY9_9DIPT